MGVGCTSALKANSAPVPVAVSGSVAPSTRIGEITAITEAGFGTAPTINPLTTSSPIVSPARMGRLVAKVSRPGVTASADALVPTAV